MPVIVMTGEDTFKWVDDGKNPLGGSENYTYYRNKDDAPEEIRKIVDAPRRDDAPRGSYGSTVEQPRQAAAAPAAAAPAEDRRGAIGRSGGNATPRQGVIGASGGNARTAPAPATYNRETGTVSSPGAAKAGGVTWAGVKQQVQQRRGSQGGQAAAPAGATAAPATTLNLPASIPVTSLQAPTPVEMWKKAYDATPPYQRTIGQDIINELSKTPAGADFVNQTAAFIAPGGPLETSTAGTRAVANATARGIDQAVASIPNMVANPPRAYLDYRPAANAINSAMQPAAADSSVRALEGYALLGKAINTVMQNPSAQAVAQGGASGAALGTQGMARAGAAIGKGLQDASTVAGQFGAAANRIVDSWLKQDTPLGGLAPSTWAGNRLMDAGRAVANNVAPVAEWGKGARDAWLKLDSPLGGMAPSTWAGDRLVDASRAAGAAINSAARGGDDSLTRQLEYYRALGTAANNVGKFAGETAGLMGNAAAKTNSAILTSGRGLMGLYEGVANLPNTAMAAATREVERSLEPYPAASDTGRNLMQYGPSVPGRIAQGLDTAINGDMRYAQPPLSFAEGNARIQNQQNMVNRPNQVDIVQGNLPPLMSYLAQGNTVEDFARAPVERPQSYTTYLPTYSSGTPTRAPSFGGGYEPAPLQDQAGLYLPQARASDESLAKLRAIQEIMNPSPSPDINWRRHYGLGG